jgi:hypothetical protein
MSGIPAWAVRGAKVVCIRQHYDYTWDWQRKWVPNCPSNGAVYAEYGFSRYFLRHILNGRATTVSAFGYEQLLAARKAEMLALVEHLQAEIETLTAHDDADILALGRELEDIEDHLMGRRAKKAAVK